MGRWYIQIDKRLKQFIAYYPIDNYYKFYIHSHNRQIEMWIIYNIDRYIDG